MKIIIELKIIFMEELINFWRQFQPNDNGGQLIHLGDLNALNDVDMQYFTFHDYVNNPDNLFISNTIIHSGLIPVPYSGDLTNAEIFILMINPGFDHNDYYSETIPEYRNALISNLHQENLNEDYPFFYLNPLFCHTSGGAYWLKKFNNIIKTLYQQGYGYEQILSLISKNTCVLELFPYHSKNFNISNIILNNCASVSLIRDFVQSIIENNKLVICLRQPNNWHINQNNAQNLHILPANQRQSASLNVNEGNVGQIIYNNLIDIAIQPNN